MAGTSPNCALPGSTSRGTQCLSVLAGGVNSINAVKVLSGLALVWLQVFPLATNS